MGRGRLDEARTAAAAGACIAREIGDAALADALARALASAIAGRPTTNAAAHD